MGDRTERNARQRETRNRYNATTYTAVTIRVRQDGGDGVTVDQIRQAAEADGVSLNSWLLGAIRDRLC